MTTTAEVAHLLRRAGYGGRPEEIEALSGLERNELIRIVMARRPEPPPVPDFVTSPDPGLEEWVRLERLGNWWLDRMVESSVTDTAAPSPIVERMTMFWHNHFATSAEKAYNTKALYDQNDLFRREGLGNFRTLCREMSVQVAMLVYLDNQYNTKGSPNQNFARELMELFVLGIGNYTEDDVVAGAAAWSGHGLDYDADWRNPVYAFHPDEHDTETRAFLGRTAVWDGPDTIDWMLDSPATAPVAARFIARKLWTWLAYPGPPAAAVDAIAEALLSSDWEIAPAVHTLFLRDEFWSVAAAQGLLRTPVEFVVATAKALGVPASLFNPQWALAQMGQQPFYPPNVSGWRVNDYWVSTSAASARADFVESALWAVMGDEGPNPGFLCDVTGEGEGNVFVPYDERVPTATVVAGALRRFAVVDPAPGTVRTLSEWHTAYRTPPPGEWPWGERHFLTQLILLSPDFHLA